jgi:ADP-ribosylglycohydrolase
MRYSLSSRFGGTLLGAAVGEMLGKSTSVKADSQWGRLAVLGIQSLIRLGRFDLDDWRYAFLSVDSIPRTFRPSSNQNAMNCVFTKAIIATVPLALFYHENETKLRQNLQNFLVAVGQDDPVSRDGTLAVGYAIAQCLTEKLNSATLIPQTIAFLESQTLLAQQLAQVQTLLEQRAGLERAVTHLGAGTQPSTLIALAFYCFLSTLEDLRLSVMRAAQKGYHPQITSTITGALSGAYNSTAGIPATLRMALSQPDNKLAAWGMTTEAEMLKLSNSLVAVWSGVYNQAEHLTEVMPATAIAAPNVIRSR